MTSEVGGQFKFMFHYPAIWKAWVQFTSMNSGTRNKARLHATSYWSQMSSGLLIMKPGKQYNPVSSVWLWQKQGQRIFYSAGSD
jgi:hypothetical protein